MSGRSRPAGWELRDRRTGAKPKTERETWGASDTVGRTAGGLDLDELAERAELRAGAWRRARGLQ